MINQIVKKYLEYRLKQFDFFSNNPIEVQQRVFKKIIKDSSSSQFLSKRGLSKNSSYEHYTKKVDVSSYEELFPIIDSMMKGDSGILVPQKINWYSKSSGTTNGQSKFIPLTKSFLFNNHIRASWFAAALVYKHNPKAKIFKYKNLLMGGTLQSHREYKDVLIGDISGFTISNIPAVGRPFYTPDFKTALLENWDDKIEKMAQICAQHKVFLCAGVPTWTIILFEKMLALHPAENIKEIWPELSVYMHGGVNFNPYKNQFKKYLPDPNFHYMEVYNASEGCFAIQHKKQQEGMMLLLDNEIFYEFIPADQSTDNRESPIPLEDVKADIPYVMLITNSAGLYRYKIGDVVKFSSTAPYILKVIGRTKEYINAFGEELIIENAETALASTSNLFNAEINNYSVAPKYISGNQKGNHQWFIEFKTKPKNMDDFARILDSSLQKLNSDYAAKRYKDMALIQLELINLPSGTFEQWLRSKGKFGNQNKVPRLKNDRVIAEELLSMI